MNREILIYTDGSCKGNPGPGGWAFVALSNNKEILTEQDEGERDTTNNRMEMTAIIKALNWTTEQKDVNKITIHSDSSLLINTLTKGWKKKANSDLWKELDQALVKLEQRGIDVNWKWVKGHVGNKFNELVDKLAVSAAEAVTGVPTNGTKSVSKSPAPTLGLEFAGDSALRDQLSETIFDCKNCSKKTAGHLSRKTETGPIRVDCENCGKYIKFAKQAK